MGILSAWGPGFGQVDAEGWGGGHEWGNLICQSKLFIREGDKFDGGGRGAPVYHVYPVRRTTSEQRTACWTRAHNPITARCVLEG